MGFSRLNIEKQEREEGLYFLGGSAENRTHMTVRHADLSKNGTLFTCIRVTRL